MKASRKSVLALIGAMAMGAAVAAPSVEIVSVQQQYPWTNTVDIVYNVAGVASETNGYFVVFTPTTSTGAAIPDVNGETSVQVALKGSGVYSTQWFPQTNQQYTACRMTPSVFRGAAKDYMIVDLLTGAVTYEPMATQAASNQRYNTAEYKTTKMVFRRVEPDTYDVQDGTRTATFDKPYYIAIFALTEGQYNLIMGSGAATSAKAKGGISYNHVRSSSLATARVPDSANGPVGKLNARVHASGNADLYFDLPNGAMWEVAARANCPADWVRPGSTNVTTAGTLSDYAWWSGNSAYNDNKVVGLRKPNDWGIYDMLGNMWENCRDTFASQRYDPAVNYPDLMTYTLEPKSFGGGTACTSRGGRSGDELKYVRYSCNVLSHGVNSTSGFLGCRLAVIVE